MFSAIVNLTPLNVENLLKSLEIIWKSALSVAIVITLIILTVKLIVFCINKYQSYKQNSTKSDSPPDEV